MVLILNVHTLFLLVEATLIFEAVHRGCYDILEGLGILQNAQKLRENSLLYFGCDPLTQNGPCN